MTPQPVLYSFRRCPFAIRARLSLLISETSYELREVLLRDKPPELLLLSPKGTVPVLLLPDGRLLDESLDIMLWCLRICDPDSWLPSSEEVLAEVLALIGETQDRFKPNLDGYKYVRPGQEVESLRCRKRASEFLRKLDRMLEQNQHLHGARFALGDAAIAPFVRQFASTDRTWFDAQDWPHLREWLDRFLDSSFFKQVMQKATP